MDIPTLKLWKDITLNHKSDTLSNLLNIFSNCFVELWINNFSTLCVEESFAKRVLLLCAALLYLSNFHISTKEIGQQVILCLMIWYLLDYMVLEKWQILVWNFRTVSYIPITYVGAYFYFFERIVLKFIYSEKAIKFSDHLTFDWHYIGQT